jgi:hypothetical protein
LDEPLEAKAKSELGEHEPCEDDLRQGVRLADEERVHGKRARQHPRQHHRADDEDIPAHHRDHEPRRQLSRKPQSDVDADEQRLVGDGVEIGAKLGVPFVTLGQEAIGGIGEAREQEQQEGRQHLMGDDQPHHERNEHDPHESEAVGDIHVTFLQKRSASRSATKPLPRILADSRPARVKG